MLDHRIGGPHIYVDTLRKVLKGKVESIVVTTGRGAMTDMALLNLRHFWVPLYALEIIANVLLLVCMVLFGRIKRRAVIFNVHGGANLAPVLAARIGGIPVVWSFHEITPQFRTLVALGRWFLKGHPHTLVTVANKAKEIYRLEDAVLIPAAVDTSFWSRDEVSEVDLDACGWLNLDESGERPFRMLAVGNLNPLKGMDILLDAIAAVDGPWHLKIVGAILNTHREYAAMLYRRAQQISSAKKGCVIDFLGWQEKIQVRTLLANTDVFVLPSRSEACPIALLEAMAMGCHCIAADVGDVSRMTESYLSCEIYSFGSVDDLRQSVKKAQLSRKAPVLRSGCRSGEASFKVIADKTFLVYSRLLTKS